MLQQRLGLSLPTIKKLGSWSPIDEPCLTAWYKFRTGVTITPVVDPKVQGWLDSSTNSHYMEQLTVVEQPTYNAGQITFVSSGPEYLSTSSQISLTGDFSIGLSINTNTINGAFLADVTSSNELFKYSAADKIQVKIAGTSSNLELDSGTFSDNTIIITRRSNVLTLWKDGVEQTGTTPTISGTALIDAIGARWGSGGTGNAFDGVIREVQIYSCSNELLTEQIHDSLKHLIS